MGQFLAYNFKDKLRPDGYNMIDRWSGGWDPSGELADVPPPYFDAMKATYTLEIESQEAINSPSRLPDGRRPRRTTPRVPRPPTASS